MNSNTSIKDIRTDLRDIKSMLTMVHQAVKAVEVRLAFESDDQIDVADCPKMLTTIKPNFEFLDRPRARDIHENWNSKRSREDRLICLLKYQMKQKFEKHSLEQLYIPSEQAYYQKILQRSEHICKEFVNSMTENGYICPADVFYHGLESTIAEKLHKYDIEPQRCENNWAARLWCLPFIHTEIPFGIQQLVILKTDNDLSDET